MRREGFVERLIQPMAWDPPGPWPARRARNVQASSLLGSRGARMLLFGRVLGRFDIVCGVGEFRTQVLQGLGSCVEKLRRFCRGTYVREV